MPAITASSSTSSSARPPSSCARAPRACAISAPACRRPTPSSCCRASRRWRRAWSATSRTPRAVLDFLTANKAVEWVLHPALENHPDHELAQAAAAEGRRLDRQLRHQGRPRGRQEIHRGAAADQPSRQCRRRQDAGDSSGQHHASADGRGAARRPPGVGEELVRLSVGIETAADIIDDLGQALRASQKV